VKKVKIMLIASMLLLVLFLPAIKMKVPAAEACVPTEPVEVQEIAGAEKQQIINILLSSPKILTAIKWLSSKNITIDTEFDSIKAFNVNYNNTNYYTAIIPQIAVNKQEFGAVAVILETDMSILYVVAIFMKSTAVTKSRFIETFIIDNTKGGQEYVTSVYALYTKQCRVYTIEEEFNYDANVKFSDEQMYIACYWACWGSIVGLCAAIGGWGGAAICSMAAAPVCAAICSYLAYGSVNPCDVGCEGVCEPVCHSAVGSKIGHWAILICAPLCFIICEAIC